MELRTLKYFLSLYSEKSFTAAAEANFISQPAISIQLKNLQREMGITLYETSGRKVSFTDAGMIVLQYARRFAGLEKQLLEHVRDMQELKKGKLSLGTIDAASIYILPGVFRAFRNSYPAIEMNLEIASTYPLFRELDRGELDLVVGSLPLEVSGDYRIFRIFSEPLVFISPRQHPLSGRGTLEPAELAGHPFILFQKGSVTRRIIENALREQGVEPEVSMAIDSQEAIKHLVSSGLGLSVLPMKTVESEIGSGQLNILDVCGVDLRRDIGLIVPVSRYLPMTARAFLGAMKSELGIDLPAKYCMRGE
ncbi:MAG: LysR family transcriptional regulator [Candidatus Latescibacteria bacterium]|nr:LysR family transcriptional regulator [bacterium]MBD3423998.1 LysR family transcriptional regulator [Candidatus Latescibacterota bacterium]